MLVHSLHCPDNGSNMCGSADKLFLSGVPTCSECGFKTDIYFINPEFKLKRRVYDLSATYDGYCIASLKLVEACKRLNLQGVNFLSLPSDSEFFVVKPVVITPFDFKSRKTRFESLCSSCNQYGAVAGATPVFLLSQPASDLSGTDIIFGSGNSRSRVLLATEHAKTLLQSERLKGLEFQSVAHNKSSQPTPCRGG
jgi:hypothetical protein